MREEVAENPNTPTHLLENLSNDEYYSVMWYVAANPNTPPELKRFMLLKY